MQKTLWRMNLHIDLWNQSHLDSDFSSLNILVRKRELEILYQEECLGKKQVKGICHFNQDTMTSHLNSMCWGI